MIKKLNIIFSFVLIAVICGGMVLTCSIEAEKNSYYIYDYESLKQEAERVYYDVLIDNGIEKKEAEHSCKVLDFLGVYNGVYVTVFAGGNNAYGSEIIFEEGLSFKLNQATNFGAVYKNKYYDLVKAYKSGLISRRNVQTIMSIFDKKQSDKTERYYGKYDKTEVTYFAGEGRGYSTTILNYAFSFSDGGHIQVNGRYNLERDIDFLLKYNYLTEEDITTIYSLNADYETNKNRDRLI